MKVSAAQSTAEHTRLGPQRTCATESETRINLQLLHAMSQPSLPILSVSPSRAMVDEKLKVLVENLPPGLPVTLHSLHLSEDNDYWEAYGHYVSDHRGVVSVPDDISFGGTYTGKEAMGLIWSMRPVPDGRKDLRLRKNDVSTPLLVNISVYSGHEAQGFRSRTPLASTVVERWYMAPGVKRVIINERGVQGTLFIPPGPGPFPGLLDMWGGGGGLVEYRAALLASHGYVAMALLYLSSRDMRLDKQKFSYFETAFNIIKEHPQVAADKVGMFGLSLGSIVAIYLAAENTDIEPVCCVGISGGHVKPREQDISGITKMLDLNPANIVMDENGYQIWKEKNLAIISDPANLLDVGKIKCPFLMVTGLDDQNWPAVECSRDMSQKMRAAGKEHLLTVLEYPETGHLIEPPFSPHFRATTFRKNVKLRWGGTTKPHSDAQEDAWKKILVFLEHHLYSNPTPRAKM